jgi:hypothetical protein
MSIGVLVALISAAVALCGAGFTAYSTARAIRLQDALSLNRARLDRRLATEDLIRRYSEPLLLAAFDLQARIHNIVDSGFVARHMSSSDPEERAYPRVSTLYRIGDYFGWIEILRRGLQFLDLGEQERTRELSEHLDLVSHIFSNTERFPSASVFRLFRDEQRAVGEVMLEPVDGEVRRYQCIGYVTFVERLEKEPGFARWFERLGRETERLRDPAHGQLDRMIELQHALIKLIAFLDPEGLRFSKAHIHPLHPQILALPGVSQDSSGERLLES